MLQAVRGALPSTRRLLPPNITANRIRLIAITLAVIVSLVACSKQSPMMQALANDAVILAFGDSLTQGTGTKPGFGYPQQLQELIGFRVINAGVAGEISRDGLARLPQLLDAHSPALVILCHGGNDLLRKLDKNQLRDNLSAMVALIRQSGAEVVLLGVPKPALLLGAADVYVEVADKHQVVTNLEIFAKVLSRPSLKSDPVHPNAAGYRQIAEAIHATLSDAGAL